MAEIDVTSVCNCRCAFCFQGDSHNDKEQVLTFDEICFLLDRLLDMGCYYLSFSGGEPFCRSDFVEILKEAKKRGFYITFASQLQLASNEQIKQINEIGIERVLVSFHSYDIKHYTNIFGVSEDKYWCALDNVKQLLAGGTPVTIAVTVSNINASDLIETRNFFMKLGIEKDRIRFNPLLTGKNSVEAIRGAEEFCNHLRKNLDLEINTLSALRTNRLSLICSAGRTSCLIHPNGDVTACGFISEIAGNIREQDIEKIWLSADIFKQIRALHEEDFVECFHCEHKDTCQVCIGNNYNETGSFIQPSKTYCNFRKDLSEVFGK